MKELIALDSRFDAAILGQLLEENDIPFLVQANDGGGMFPTNANFESVKVMVSDEDYEKALNLIQEESAEN